MTADDVIRILGLIPLPQEGGFYRETFKSSLKVSVPGTGAKRDAGSAIYFLVTPENFSAFHRLAFDEIIHFYAGDAVELLQIDGAANLQKTLIGNRLERGELPQMLVPAKCWQGLRLKSGGAWALLGDTMAPGFHWDDFELGKRAELIAAYPILKKEILELTR